MDENKGFPIPPKGGKDNIGKGKMGADMGKKGMPKMPKAEGPMPIGENPMSGKEELVKTFEKDGKAVNVVSVSVDDNGEVLETLDDQQLEEYAMGLLDGDSDVSELMVGEIFEGPDAGAKAKEMAGKLNKEFAPGAGASEEDLADAAVKAQAKAVTMDIETEDKPIDLSAPLGEEPVGPEGPATLFGSEEYNKENEKLGEELDENEPILGQMKKAGMAE